MKRNLWRIVWLVVMLLGGISADAAPPPADGTPAQPAEGLDLRYARAQLALAETNLKRVELINKQVARAVSGKVVDEYRGDVDVARVRLEAAERGESDSFQVWLRAAEASVKSAERAWQNATIANQHMPGTVEPVDVERLRLRAEVYRIDLERGRALAGGPHEAQLEWRVRMLSDEVDRLNEAVFRMGPPRSSYLFWRY
jgi:hypothetical protein